jgi:hypothetical protein
VVDDTWRTVLLASLDPAISDQALRLALGITPLVRERITGKRFDAYLDQVAVEHATGLDRRTAYAAADEVRDRLGLVRLVHRGTTNKVVDGKRGEASAWTTLDPAAWEGDLPDLDLDQAKALLDPADKRWSRQHRAWRLAVALVATYGLVDLGHVTNAQMARLLGVDRRNIGRIRTAMVEALPCGLDLTGDLSPWTEANIGPVMARRQRVRREAWLDGLRNHDQPEPEPLRPVEDVVVDLPVITVLRDRLRPNVIRSEVSSDA